MKLQDIIFIFIFIILLKLNIPRLLVLTALACFIISGLLYWKWIFFTAERLVIYGVFMIAADIIISLTHLHKVQS